MWLATRNFPRKTPSSKCHAWLVAPDSKMAWRWEPPSLWGSLKMAHLIEIFARLTLSLRISMASPKIFAKGIRSPGVAQCPPPRVRDHVIKTALLASPREGFFRSNSSAGVIDPCSIKLRLVGAGSHEPASMGAGKAWCEGSTRRIGGGERLRPRELACPDVGCGAHCTIAYSLSSVRPTYFFVRDLIFLAPLFSRNRPPFRPHLVVFIILSILDFPAGWLPAQFMRYSF